MIRASADDTWVVVGEGIARFGPVAAGVIEERLLRFDPVIPGPDATATCAVKIHAVLTLRPAMRPLGPVLRWRMRNDSRQTLDELRQRVEAGRPHASTLP